MATESPKSVGMNNYGSSLENVRMLFAFSYLYRTIYEQMLKSTVPSLYKTDNLNNLKSWSNIQWKLHITWILSLTNIFIYL